MTADPMLYDVLKEHAERMKKYPTGAENLLWNYLKGEKLGCRFRRQHIIFDYIPDFVCLPLKLIVEIDGGYHAEGEQPERDTQRTKELIQHGYTILRFTNEEIYKDTYSAIIKIKHTMSQLENIRHSVSPPSEGPGEASGKLIIFSAPSGSGKSTIVGYLMREHPELRLAFSISCTSRPPRGQERNGVEYFFITPEEFRRKIEAGEFLEHEEVYKDRFYGTLRSQVDTQLARGENVVFDVDVKGGVNIKKAYGNRALSVFIQPPSLQELRRRLEGRGTDTAEAIENRLAKAEYELTFAPQFDRIVVNDDLAKAEAETYRIVSEFLKA